VAAGGHEGGGKVGGEQTTHHPKEK
jgi:hypothetical protein